MNLSRSRVVIALLMLFVALPVSGQTGATPDDTVSPAELRQLRAEAERNASLTDDLRAQILELYDVALGSLESATDNRAATRNFESQRSGTDRMVADLRAELDKPERQPRLSLPESDGGAGRGRDGP